MKKEESEPRTMARVQGLVESRYRKRPYNVWITHKAKTATRHVSVKFGKEWFEGSGSTWLLALEALDASRLNK